MKLRISQRVFVVPALAASFFFSFWAFSALAQVPSEGTRQDVRREELKQRIGELRERLSEVKQKRVRLYWGMMEKRMTNAIDRHERIVNRIETRIAKFEEKGVDVSVAKSKLVDGRARLASAKSALENAKAAVEELLASDDPKGVFPEVRDHVKAVRDAIKEAHQVLVDAIVALRASEKNARVETGATNETPPANP